MHLFDPFSAGPHLALLYRSSNSANFARSCSLKIGAWELVAETPNQRYRDLGVDQLRRPNDPTCRSAKEWNADVDAKMVVGVGKFAWSLTRKAFYYRNHLTANCRGG